MEHCSDDNVLEILSNLDAVSVARFMSTSNRFWKLRNNRIILNRTIPYQKYIIYQQWNHGLRESIERRNYCEMKYFLEKGADDNDVGLYRASLIGNCSLVNYFLDMGATDIDNAILYAAQGGHKCIIDILTSNHTLADFYQEEILSKAVESENMELIVDLVKTASQTAKNKALAPAVQGGNKNIIDCLISSGVNNWAEATRGAIATGNKDLAEFYWNKMGALDKIRRNFDLCIEACKKGHKDIVEWMVQCEFSSWETGLYHSALGGHRDLVEYFIKQGAMQFGAGLREAAQGGHIELMKFFIEKGATTLDEALVRASQSDHREAILWLIQQGAQDFDNALKTAALNGHLSLVALYVEKGATGIDTALIKAAGSGYLRTVEYLVNKGATTLQQARRTANNYGQKDRGVDFSKNRPKKLVTVKFLTDNEDRDSNYIVIHT